MSRHYRGSGQARVRRAAWLAASDRRCVLRLEGCTGVADTVDHVVPVAYGGADTPDNWRPACRHCNSSAGGRLAHVRSPEPNATPVRSGLLASTATLRGGGGVGGGLLALRPGASDTPDFASPFFVRPTQPPPATERGNERPFALGSGA